MEERSVILNMGTGVINKGDRVLKTGTAVLHIPDYVRKALGAGASALGFSSTAPFDPLICIDVNPSIIVRFEASTKIASALAALFGMR